MQPPHLSGPSWSQSLIDQLNVIFKYVYSRLGEGGQGEHTHPVSDVDGLQDSLDAKSDEHSHPYSASDHDHDAAYAALDHAHPGGAEAFPVGSVFIAVVSTDPATLLGYGTWAAFAAGRMLVGRDGTDAAFDTAEETGGAKNSSAVVNHTHTVSVTDPGHAHVENSNNATTGGLRGWGAPDTSTNTPTATGYSTASATTGISASTANPAGGAASFSLLNPYIVVYMWKRTA